MLSPTALARPCAPQAVGGVHPHVAEEPAPANRLPGQYRGACSPLFNMPDGSWNLGEGFPPPAQRQPYVDVGGFLGRDDGDDLVEGDIRESQGWHLHTAPNGDVLWRYVGYLLPDEIDPPPPTVQDAAFEVFATSAGVGGETTLAVVGTWATFGPKLPSQGGQVAYPGDPTLDGLRRAPPGSVPDDILRPAYTYELASRGPGFGYRVIAGHIVPRIAGTPLVFQMQRNLQLAKVIRIMLDSAPTSPLHPPSFPVPGPAGVPMLIAGGSFGGLVGQLSVIYHPDVFHGCHAETLSASLRRTVGEHETWRFITTRSGFGGNDSTYDMPKSLEWPAYVRQLDSDYFNSCFTRRWVDGLVQRPALFWIGDEDTVTTGTDWAPLLGGERKYQDTFDATSGNSSAALAMVDRRCHVGGFFESPFGSGTRSDPYDMILEFAPRAVDSHTANPLVGPPPPLTDDGSEDPFDHALTRIWAPSTAGSGLVLDTAFGAGGRTPGQGVALGNDESLKVHAGGIYVGSADGVVTRFVLNASTRELDVDTYTDPGTGQPLPAQSQVLGYAAWALDVGDVDPGNEGAEVVVGTYRHVWLLDAETLGVLRSRALPYEHSRPRRVQIVDLFPGSPDAEIVFATFYGHLVVLDEQLDVVADYPEPGIQDLMVADPGLRNEASETASKVMVALMSHRGHIANVTLDAEPDPTQHVARLHAWTDPQLGVPVDIEAYFEPNQWVIAALYSHQELAYDKTIRLFDALTMAPIADLPSDVGALNHRQRAIDLAVTRKSGGEVHYVVTNPPDIFLIDSTGTTVGDKRLGSFAPALHPLALQVADIFGNDTGTDFADEVILATESGHVVWFEVDALLGLSDDNLNLPRVVGSDMPHTNRTLAATWGMLTRDMCKECVGGLEVADQSGSRWSVDPSTGSATFVHDMRSGFFFAGASTAEDPIFPIRDLVALDADIQGRVSDPALTFWRPPLRIGSTEIPGNEGFLESRPWQNEVLSFLAPLWAMDPPPAQPSTIPPNLYVYRHGDHDYVAFPSGGDALPVGDPVAGAIGQAHWWGGEHHTYVNLLQGVFFDATQITRWWASSNDEPNGQSGRGAADNKDLRNIVREPQSSINSPGSLRMTEDDDGPLIVASTPGGSVVLVRPGTDSTSRGTIVWDSADGIPGGLANADYGYGGMGLAVVPDQAGKVDIFLGVLLHHADPVPHAQPPGQGRGPGPMVGAVAWLRWDDPDDTMSQQALLVFDPDPQAQPPDPGAFAVCGLAVGDLLQDAQNPGDELVVATLDGDLRVHSLVSGLANPPVFRTRLPGSVGAYNALVIDDADMDGQNELYVGGSMGIWKFKQQ